MSLYGNVKKIGSASFQFDRVYANRAAMDAAAASDAVYAGRYVLVEYGERFNGVSSGEAVEYSGQPNVYTVTRTNENGSYQVQVHENESFINNANIDLEQYGAVYDSTVWQKVFVNNKDKYIMVAELNAMAPKLDVTQDKPITYTKSQVEYIEDYKTKGIITGKVDENGTLTETVRLVNAVENYNKPYFDTALDTELSYLMHFPSTLNLKIDNDTIDFNENGFNMAYSYKDHDGVSTIAWVPDGLTDYTVLSGSEAGTDQNGNPLAKLVNGADVDTKMLFMSFPALGNAMNALYNLLYGQPEPGADLEHGALRPYFKKFLSSAVMTNYLTIDYNGEIRKVYHVNGDELELIPLSSTIVDVYGNPTVWQTIPIPDVTWLNDDGGPHFDPDCVELRYKTNGNEYLSWANAQAYLTDFGNWYLYNNQTERPVSYEFHVPTGDEDPNLEWLKSIPSLSEILANNTAGLATILSNLFGETDPLTGTIRYYLYNDWTTEIQNDSSGPAIVNKPMVVGGYKQTFVDVPSGESKTEQNGYETDGFWPDLGGTEGSIIYYPHTETHISDEFSEGHYKVDYDSWQLVQIMQEPIG